MARSPSELQGILKELDGVTDAYFQPPTSGLVPPYIMIERGVRNDVSFSDNIKYLLKKGYTVTIVDRDPLSLIPDLVEGLPYSTYDRFFKVNGLNHFVFQLFF